MQLFCNTTYRLYHNDVKEPFKTLIISDIHFNNKMKDSKLKYIYEKILELNPKYIFIAGDLIDSSNELDIQEQRYRLFNWIQQLSELSKVVISIGNHDYYRKNKKSEEWSYFYDSKFFESLKMLENIYVLNNDSYEDDQIYVTGVTNSFSYYHPPYKDMHQTEDKSKMLEDLKILPQNIPSDKIKFIMIHSPIYLDDTTVSEKLSGYDYFISGHMHNGCVPPIINELWNSTRGFISPAKKLLPKNARNTLRNIQDKLIVNGAITTLSKCAGLLSYLNILYPMCSTTLELTNEQKENIYVKRKYY